MKFCYEEDPSPHLIIEEIVPPDRYEELDFPDRLIADDTAWGLTGSDERYAEVLADPGWGRLHDEVRGEIFVRTVLNAFRSDMREGGCLTEADRARLIPYVETREDKELEALDSDADPNEVYTRLDFQSKAAGAYREFVHLDWPRRIVGGIFFFSDADEEGLEGGELALYRDREFRNDRWCHDPELVKMVRPRHNTGVIFLNSNRGFHGPRAITRLEGRRRWLYFTISSKVSVWPCP